MIPSKAPAIARAAAILRLLGKSETPVGVNHIARALELVPSTCLYVLRALVGEELVAFDSDTKRYSLDAGVLTLARGWLRRDQFSDLAQPVLDRIAREYGVTMLGVQIVRYEHMVVIAKAEGGANFQLSAHIGSRFPALISATGRCLAAFGGMAEHDLQRQFKQLRWDASPTFAEWRGQVAATKARGYAVDEGNYIAGVCVIAAPVWKAPGSPSHALVAVGLSGAMHRAGVPQIGRELVSTSQSMSERLNRS